jgi:DNA-binding protein YbaB
MVDLDRYAREMASVRSVQKRLEKVSDQFEAWRRACAAVSMNASAGGGDVTVTVSDHGRMTSIEIVEGAMSQYTHLSLEKLINRALHAAQGSATEELAEIDAMIGPGDFLAAFDEGLASSTE